MSQKNQKHKTKNQEETTVETTEISKLFRPLGKHEIYLIVISWL